VKEGDFATMDFDEQKVKDMLKRHGTDNSVHDNATIAVTFTELVSCKKM
jgi:hypothetical protein